MAGIPPNLNTYPSTPYQQPNTAAPANNTPQVVAQVPNTFTPGEPYYQPDSFFGGYDPGTLRTNCPVCNSPASIVGSSRYVFACDGTLSSNGEHQFDFPTSENVVTLSGQTQAGGIAAIRGGVSF